MAKLGRKQEIEFKYYDPEVKERYIKETYAKITLPDKSLERMFTMSQPFEDKLHKDVCEFTKTEIENMYRAIGFRSITTLVNTHRRFALYTFWGMENNMVYDCINHFDDISVKELSQYCNKVVQNKQIVTREQLLGMLDRVSEFNPCDAFGLLAVFEGVGGNNWVDLVYAKCSNFHKENGKWYFDLFRGYTIEVSDELAEYAKLADLATDYFFYKDEDNYTHRPFVDTDLIFKPVAAGHYREDSDDFALGRRIYNRLNKAIRYLQNVYHNPGLSVKGIRNSGLIHYLNTWAKENDMSVADYVRTKDGLRKYCMVYLGEENLQYFIGQIRGNFCSTYEDFLN